MAKGAQPRSVSRKVDSNDEHPLFTLTDVQVRRMMWRYPISLLAMSAALLLMAAGVWIWIGQGPDESGSPIEVTAAMLADGSAPTGQRIMLRGVSIETARARVRRSMRAGVTRWTYTGFRADVSRGDLSGEGSDTAPLALFTAIWWGTIADTIAHRPASEIVEGVLVENGLPGDARAALEAQGVSIATRHYVLEVGKDGSRAGWMPVVWIGLIFGGLLGIMGAVEALKTARLPGVDMAP